MEGCSEIPRFAGDSQVLQVVGYLTEGEQIQKFTELNKWTNMWQTNFNKAKCGVYLGENYLCDGEPGSAQEGVWKSAAAVV